MWRYRQCVESRREGPKLKCISNVNVVKNYRRNPEFKQRRPCNYISNGSNDIMVKLLIFLQDFNMVKIESRLQTNSIMVQH